MNDAVRAPITRRRLLGSAIAGGLLLAGCGGRSAPTGTGTAASGPITAPTGPRTMGGTFRFSPSDFSGSTVVDPQANSTGFHLTSAYTDRLLERTHDYKDIQLALAEEFEPEGDDLQTWTIRLRDSVEFSHGKTLDADDVIFTIRRNVNPDSPGFTAGLMTAIDPNGLEKLDARTVRLHLKFPNSQLRNAFAEIPSAIVPVDFDPNHPVGTGPFKQVSFQPGQRWVGVRNENHWREDGPYLDQLELIGFTDANVARVNALISGQIDGIDHILPTQVAQLHGRDDLTVIVSETGAFEQIGMNVTKGSPFEDNRVRQAFRLLVDRRMLVNAVYGGYGDVGNDTGVWSQFDPAYDETIPQRERDVEQAKSLLKAAGQDGMAVAIRVAELVPGMIQTAEILIQNAKEAGVSVELNEVTDLAQHYGSEEYYTSTIKIDYDYTQTVYDNLSYCWLPGTKFNNVGFEDPRIPQLYQEALRSTGAKYKEVAGEVSRLIHDEGPWIVWGRRNIPDAHTTKFTGAVQDSTGTGFNGYRWHEISLA